MCLFEAILVAIAQLQHGRHVHFVERGQDGRGRLRLHEPLGNALAQTRHRHALLGAPAKIGRQRHGWRLGRRRRGRSRCDRRRRGLGDVAACLNDSLDVALGQAAAASRARYVGGVDPLVCHDLARCGQCRRCARWRNRGRCCGHGWRRARRRCGRSGLRRRSRRGRLRARIDHGDDFLRFDRRAIGSTDLGDYAGIGRRQLEDDLVRLDVDQIFVPLDRLACFLVPADERRFGDRFRQDRHFHFDEHVASLSDSATAFVLNARCNDASAL